MTPKPLTPSSPWHKESYDNFINDQLPQLLAARLPLAGYQVTAIAQQTYTIAVAIRNGNGEIEVEYTDIPVPSERGTFQIEGKETVVIPLALDDQLDQAEIECVGEQIYNEIEAQLGEAPEHIPWDAGLLKAWLPLSQWITEFISGRGQTLDTTNWLAAQRHLRAILIPDRTALFTPGHFGRVCPFETPEGPNIGKVLRVAVGAAIQDRKLMITDSSSTAGLGVNASMIPLLEHDDPNRLLMGANMLGQWLVPPDPEPALVQTGFEPEAPDFWCGRNLLTAFISAGAGTYEDALTLSESAARRLNYPHELELGDKLSNRHGTKGVVARILPDEQMPHLSDGTPIELLYSFMGVPLRMNFGQIREALLGRIAHIEGQSILSPPYGAPSEAEISAKLQDNGLPLEGMETLSMSKNGAPMARPSMAGYVYWGKTAHLSRFKLMCGQDVSAEEARAHGLQRQAELEYQALREAGALKVAESVYTLQAAGQSLEGVLSPKFAALQARLKAAGIQATPQVDGGLAFEFASPAGETLTLAQPMPHPWLLSKELNEVGIFAALPEYEPLVEANTRLSRLLESQAPKSLTEGAAAQLEKALHDYLFALLTPVDLRFDTRVAFSGRATIVPGGDLLLDQVGIPEEMAWTFFGPQVAERLGQNALDNRTGAAIEIIDEIMAASWVVINRAPSTSPTAVLAFHPVRVPGPSVHIHSLICRWLNADFDGDQVAVYLPLGKEVQMDAAEKLSVAGHLRRDPALIRTLSPEKDYIWGLGSLALEEAGRARIKTQTGVDLPSPREANTQAALEQAMVDLLVVQGPESALEIIEKLRKLGEEFICKSGASISPFVGVEVDWIPAPQSDDPQRWREYVSQLAQQFTAFNDYADPDLGVHLTTMKTRSQPPQLRGLIWLFANRDPATDVNGKTIILRSSHVSGLSPIEMNACAVGAREGLGRVAQQWDQISRIAPAGSDHTRFNVLARARRAQYPGIVFARAAAIGERDPLTDLDSRLFVGLPAD